LPMFVPSRRAPFPQGKPYRASWQDWAIRSFGRSPQSIQTTTITCRSRQHRRGAFCPTCAAGFSEDTSATRGVGAPPPPAGRQHGHAPVRPQPAREPAPCGGAARLAPEKSPLHASLTSVPGDNSVASSCLRWLGSIWRCHLGARRPPVLQPRGGSGSITPE
jgi:hypothetical protein